MFKFSSKQALDSGKQQFNLLPADDYQFVIVKQEPRTQTKYQSTETEDVINFTLEIVGFKDGSAAVDEKGEPANGRKMFFTARPNSIGFTQAGVPSITRQFVGFAMGLDDLEQDFELMSWEQLLGKTVYGEIVSKTNQKGLKVNRIARFLKAPRQKQ